MNKGLSFLTLLLLACVMSATTGASIPTGAPKVIVTISLSRAMMTIQKQMPSGAMREYTAPIIPIARGSLHMGTYRPTGVTDHYHMVRGSAYLENVVHFGGGATIRTSRMFQAWHESRRPATRAAVLEPDNGELLTTAIKNYGLNQTIIRVVH